MESITLWKQFCIFGSSLDPKLENFTFSPQMTKRNLKVTSFLRNEAADWNLWALHFVQEMRCSSGSPVGLFVLSSLPVHLCFLTPVLGSQRLAWNPVGCCDCVCFLHPLCNIFLFFSFHVCSYGESSNRDTSAKVRLLLYCKSDFHGYEFTC